MITQAHIPFDDQNILVTIQQWGYVAWQLKFYPTPKLGGTCNIIFEKEIIPPCPLG
jgi:hypothetical protein